MKRACCVLMLAMALVMSTAAVAYAYYYPTYTDNATSSKTTGVYIHGYAKAHVATDLHCYGYASTTSHKASNDAVVNVPWMSVSLTLSGQYINNSPSWPAGWYHTFSHQVSASGKNTDFVDVSDDFVPPNLPYSATAYASGVHSFKSSLNGLTYVCKTKTAGAGK